MVTIQKPGTVRGKARTIRYAAQFVVTKPRKKIESGILVVVRARTKAPKRLKA